MRGWIWCAAVAAAGCGARGTPGMTLRRVTLYGNGLGYFERAGHLVDDRLRLVLARGELDDVLKTLTVLDRQGAAVATVDVPTVGDGARTLAIDVRLAGGRAHDLAVSYAVPTPTWRAAYRLVLDEPGARAHAGGALLQAWAMVHNATQDDWRGVQLVLATGAPMSFQTDLHTPRYVPRPDATHLLAPGSIGPLGTDLGGGVPDRDADGIPDAEDRCPDDPGPGGADDGDGCPRRGRVVVTDSAVSVLDTIAFAGNGEGLAPTTGPILDAIAHVLAAHPDLALVEIGGFASADEREVWGLSSRRAAAVRAALVQRGVAEARLVIQPYGDTRPRDPGATEVARAKNRRVEFTILKRHDDGDDDHRGVRLDVAHAQAAVRARTAPSAVAGSVRYVVGAPIDLARGASAMVAIVDKPVAGEEVLLWRPDANAPGSDVHPFRAVRVANTSGFTLEPGPVAIFARGTFVGDTVLERLEAGATAWVPFALDGSTRVTATTAADERPVRIAAIHKGVMTVETAGVRTTRYAIAAGADPARALVVRHPRVAGFAATQLPPGSEDTGDAYLVRIPIAAGRPSTVVVEEREPRRRALAIVDARVDELAAYVAGSHLDADTAARLDVAIAARKDLAGLEEQRARVRGEIADDSARAGELRDSLRALERVRGAEALRARVLASLAAATAAGDANARELGRLGEAVAAARAKLADAIRDLTLDATTATART